MTDRLARIRRILSVMMPVEATPNIHGYLWLKQIYCVLLSAQAVTDETMADVYADPRRQALLVALVREGVRVAQAAGVRLEGFDRYDLKVLADGTDA